MVIVQLGANSGHDHVYEFIRDLKQAPDKIILVEPMPFVHGELEKQYDEYNASIEKVAITTDGQPLTLWYDTASNFEVTTFSKELLEAHDCPKEQISSIEVESITFNDLVKKHKLKEIDYLFMDVEGMEANIIMSIDFSKVIVRHIQFEETHIDGYHRKGHMHKSLIEFLDNAGYVITLVNSFDSVATLTRVPEIKVDIPAMAAEVVTKVFEKIVDPAYDIKPLPEEKLLEPEVKPVTPKKKASPKKNESTI